MSEKEIKDAKAEATAEETKEIAPMKYGTAPSLIISIGRENRVYRFEMPIGAHLDECEEASLACVDVVREMKKQAKKKMDEEKAKKESESKDKDIVKKEEKK